MTWIASVSNLTPCCPSVLASFVFKHQKRPHPSVFWLFIYFILIVTTHQIPLHYGVWIVLLNPNTMIAKWHYSTHYSCKSHNSLMGECLRHYQLAFVTPGNKPWWAIFLKQILQRPKSLWKPWGLPQMLHLLWSLTAGYFPAATSFSRLSSLFIIAFLAMNFSFFTYHLYRH